MIADHITEIVVILSRLKHDYSHLNIIFLTAIWFFYIARFAFSSQKQFAKITKFQKLKYNCALISMISICLG